MVATLFSLHFFQTNNGGIELVTVDDIIIKYILVMFVFYLVAKI